MDLHSQTSGERSFALTWNSILNPTYEFKRFVATFILLEIFECYRTNSFFITNTWLDEMNSAMIKNLSFGEI